MARPEPQPPRKTFRDWLELNKTYFEVLVATLLSVMAVVVSYQSNKIATIQSTIAEQQALPHLEIRDQVQYNDTLKIYDNRIISVFNRGGQLRDFNLEKYTFLVLRKSNTFSKDSISIPIDNYYDWRSSLGEGDGLVYQFDSKHNGVKEIALRDSLSQYGYFDIETYARIQYIDIFDKTHTEYYQISPYNHRILMDSLLVIKERWLTDGFKNNFNRINESDLTIKLKNN